jgi:hypothetical protein
MPLKILFLKQIFFTCKFLINNFKKIFIYEIFFSCSPHGEAIFVFLGKFVFKNIMNNLFLRNFTKFLNIIKNFFIEKVEDFLSIFYAFFLAINSVLKNKEIGCSEKIQILKNFNLFKKCYDKETKKEKNCQSIYF